MVNPSSEVVYTMPQADKKLLTKMGIFRAGLQGVIPSYIVRTLRVHFAVHFVHLRPVQGVHSVHSPFRECTVYGWTAE